MGYYQQTALMLITHRLLETICWPHSKKDEAGKAYLIYKKAKNEQIHIMQM